jgi:hypothetical protein
LLLLLLTAQRKFIICITSVTLSTAPTLTCKHRDSPTAAAAEGQPPCSPLHKTFIDFVIMVSDYKNKKCNYTPVSKETGQARLLLPLLTAAVAECQPL